LAFAAAEAAVVEELTKEGKYEGSDVTEEAEGESINRPGLAAPLGIFYYCKKVSPHLI
jgi:hypothetical protein